MKKFVSLFLALLMAVVILPAAVSAEDAPIIIDPNSPSITGNLLEEEDREVTYQLTIPATGTFVISVMGYSDGEIKIYNQTNPTTVIGDVGFYGSETSPDNKIFSTILSPGTYVLEASGVFFGDYGRFVFTTTYSPINSNETEPNNYDTAMPIAEKQVINGVMALGDATDFFTINVPAKCCVEVTLTSYFNSSATIYSSDLYSDFGTIYANGTTVEPQTNKSSVTLKKGKYCIKVSSNDQGTYILSYKTKPEAPTFKKAKFFNKKKKAKLTWSKVSGVKGYEVFRSKKSSTAGFKKLKTVKKTNLTTAMAPLYGRYYFKIRAYKLVKGKKVYSDFCPVFYIYTYNKY